MNNRLHSIDILQIIVSIEKNTVILDIIQEGHKFVRHPLKRRGSLRCSTA